MLLYFKTILRDNCYRWLKQSRYIKQKCLSVCPSRLDGDGRGGGEGGQEGGGNGEGGFHRWNAWVEILFPSNARSPS